MEINPGQEQESRSMNNEEIQPGITMETASPLDQQDRKRGGMLLLKGAHMLLLTHTLTHTRTETHTSLGDN